MDVLVVGTITFDVIGTTRGWLSSGSLTITLDSLTYSHGGRGANCAVITRAMGTDVSLISCVGRDFADSDYHHKMVTAGIGVDDVRHADVDFSPRVFLFGDDRHTQVFYFSSLGNRERRKFVEWAGKAAKKRRHRILYCTSETPEANLSSLRTSRAHTKVYSPGHDIVLYDQDCLRQCITLTDILILNADEADHLEGKIGRSPDAVREMYNLRAVIVTHGERGAVVITERHCLTIPACPPKRLVNATGAGDAFAAGLVHQLARATTLVEAVRFGNALASLMIESPDCQSGIPAQAEVMRRFQQNYGTSDILSHLTLPHAGRRREPRLP
jgi:sugar/nucleoside kinase (ribokinase family)